MSDTKHTDTQPRIEEQERLLRYNELAELLNVSEQKLRHDVMCRKIPHIKLNRAVRFSPAAIHEWLRHNAVGVNS